MKKSFLLLILWAGLSILLSGCYPAYVTKVALDAEMKEQFPDILVSVEKVETLDGKSLVIHAKSSIGTRTHLYVLEGANYPSWSSKDTDWPITFDVVNNTPWVVAPVRGRQCSLFNFPREGLVFFKLEGNSWRQVPYEATPQNLRVNLLQNRHEYKNGSGMDRAECEYGSSNWFDGFVCQLDSKGAVYVSKETVIPIKANYGRMVTPKMRQYLDEMLNRSNASRFVHKDGSGRTIKEIVEVNFGLPNIADSNSCYFMNPVIDPDEKRSLREFIEKKAVVLQANLTRVDDNEVVLAEAEEKRLLNYQKTLGDCAQKVRRSYISQLAQENQIEFSSIAGVPSGTFKSPGTAVRVELNASGESRSFYLPRRGFRLAQISLMNCRDDRIIVEFDRDGNVLPVLEYDLNAKLKNKWEIRLPFDPKEWHVTYNLSISKNSINIVLADFQKSETIEKERVPAKIKKQYFLEARLLP